MTDVPADQQERPGIVCDMTTMDSYFDETGRMQFDTIHTAVPHLNGGMEWCWRCEAAFEWDSREVCPRGMDGGPHEPLVYEGEARRGFSLHTRGCPRHNPHPSLPLSVACACRSEAS